MKLTTLLPGPLHLVALLVAVGASTHATATTLAFNEPDFEWNQTGVGSATPYHIWEAGDFWAQNFQATGLASASQMALSLLFDSGTVPGADLLGLGVFLNGVGIGNFSVPAGITGSQTYSFSFAPVTGPDYRIEILAANSIPDGGGAVSIALGGNSFATVVPEPAGAALCSLGFLVMVWQVRLRSRYKCSLFANTKREEEHAA